MIGSQGTTQQKRLLLAMGTFQLFWLMARWVLMPDPDWRLLFVLTTCTMGITFLVALMPSGWSLKLRDRKRALLRNERMLIVVLSVLILSAGGVHASFRRFHGDEPPSFEAAKIVATEGVKDFFLNYERIPWLGKQHPPLMSLIYGLSMRLLGVDLSVTRLVALVFTVATVIVTYRLGVQLYDRSTGFAAALFLLSFPYCLHIGTMSNNDLPVAFFLAFSVLLLVRLFGQPSYALAVGAGVVIGAGLLTKYTMVFFYAVALLRFLIPGTPRLKLLPYLAVALLTSAGILGIWLLYASDIGVLSEQIQTIAGYAGFSASSGTAVLAVERAWKMSKRIETLFARLPSALGAFSIPILFLSGRKLTHRRSNSDLLVMGWVGVVCLPVAVVLPDPRYFLLAFPPLAILMAAGLQQMLTVVEPVLLLALFCSGQALYLYLVLNQAARLL